MTNDTGMRESPNRRQFWRVTWAILIVVGLIDTHRAVAQNPIRVQLCVAQQSDPKDQSKSVPDDIIEAWRAAAGEKLWSQREATRLTRESIGLVNSIEKPNEESIPIFRFDLWCDGIVAKRLTNNLNRPRVSQCLEEDSETDGCECELFPGVDESGVPKANVCGSFVLQS